MREIGKYRGKRLDGGGWIHGSLLQNEDISVIVVEFEEIACDGAVDCPYTHGAIGFEVDPKTVGQYTGWKDKDGKEIYEGDIFQEDEFYLVVVYSQKEAAFGFNSYEYVIADENFIEWESLTSYYIDNMKIIGNIHDNPELLEVKQSES